MDRERGHGLGAGCGRKAARAVNVIENPPVKTTESEYFMKSHGIMHLERAFLPAQLTQGTQVAGWFSSLNLPPGPMDLVLGADVS